ncbi:MAG: type IX secretion system sortase PorU [Candidatus Limimorpha sp.]
MFLAGLALFLLSNGNVLAANSVLSSGKWYKMSISSTGMYSIGASDLRAMGVDVSTVNPRNIRLFHNGGGMLPVINKDYYPDDLAEIPIFVYGEEDGRFDEGDYILFYARGPMVWKYFMAKDYYSHLKNPYTDYTYVFMTIGDEEGLRIETSEMPQSSFVNTVTEFLDHKVIDNDEFNINNMGCTWYFDKFDITLQRKYDFVFENLVTSRKVKMKSEVASKNGTAATFQFKYNDDVIYSKTFKPITSAYVYANMDSTNVLSVNATGSPISINVNYNRTSTSSVGWLNYISVNAWRQLVMVGNSMEFRNPECVNPAEVYQYQLRNASNAIQIWDVTNPIEPKIMPAVLDGSTLRFSVYGRQDNEFVAFNSNSYNKVVFVGMVENQNLHANKDIDYLIITNPMFQSHAERLKEIHSRIDDLVIDIVQPRYIYNEFSCGAQDISAIRNYIKMLYQNSSDEHRIKYVLLLGDASYNYKDPDVCLVPTWESKNGCIITSSVVTDDFFVCLDDNEGVMDNSTSMIDLAIGRMPVSTTEQATVVIDKIEDYLSRDSKTMDSWRNVVTFICDDEDSSFITNSETLAKSLPKWGADVIVDKIYLDAYQQVATASGQRCPDINEAISNRIEKGSLVVNYNGHGGEIGWGDERILTIDDILSWENSPMLPLFITATCEFSRYDDHTRTSAGELAYLSSKGGAISMITTARTTGGSLDIMSRAYERMFTMYDGEYPTFGDIFFNAKQKKDNNTKVFVLFGDPAIRLAYPKNNVVVTEINGNSVSFVADTLRALQHVSLKGEVRDNFGLKMNDFNGVARVSVYDKENVYSTFGDNGSASFDFKLRNSLLFNGRTEVVDGEFYIDFVIPKDINYSYGEGLISLYATDYKTDANGSFSNIIIGGYDADAVIDEKGPEVKLFIDDTLFVNGGITNENPMFIAFLKDEDGINATGAGIGHDIKASLTGATNKTYNLNKFYDSPFDVNDYGTIYYRLYNLNEGEHHLTLKVWDIYNNSTTVSLDFTVVRSENLALENLMNIPNPMSNYTRFEFEHNQKGPLDIEIHIYNISGQRVKTITESRYGTSTRIEPIVWDGTSDNGSKLPAGVYIYNVFVTNGKSEKATGYSKLVISN